MTEAVTAMLAKHRESRQKGKSTPTDMFEDAVIVPADNVDTTATAEKDTQLPAVIPPPLRAQDEPATGKSRKRAPAKKKAPGRKKKPSVFDVDADDDAAFVSDGAAPAPKQKKSQAKPPKPKATPKKKKKAEEQEEEQEQDEQAESSIEASGAFRQDTDYPSYDDGYTTTSNDGNYGDSSFVLYESSEGLHDRHKAERLRVSPVNWEEELLEEKRHTRSKAKGPRVHGKRPPPRSRAKAAVAAPVESARSHPRKRKRDDSRKSEAHKQSKINSGLSDLLSTLDRLRSDIGGLVTSKPGKEKVLWKSASHRRR